MQKRFFIIFLFSFFLIFDAKADVQIQASLNSKKITLEDEAYITVSVTGNDTSQPLAPRVPGLDFILTSVNSEVTSGYYGNSSKSNFVYTVIPSDAGQYEIPGFIIYFRGREIKSNNLSLTVEKANPQANVSPYIKIPQQDPQTKSSNPFQGGITSNPNSELPAPYWLEATVNQENPYLTQQLIYRFKFYSRLQVQMGNLQLPKFENFYSENLVPERLGREIVNGHEYSTVEFVYALYPLKTGQQTLDSAGMTIQYFEQNKNNRNTNDPFARFNGFFRGNQVRKNLRTNPIVLNVKPLPEPVPDNYINLVGEFTLSSKLLNDQIQLGDSTTLEIEISGHGNLKDAILPSWNLPNFKIYEDKPVLDTQVQETGIYGTKTFKVALVPTQTGMTELPKLSLSYFDPKLEKYISLDTQRFVLTVADNKSEKNQNSVFAEKNQNTVSNSSVSSEISPLHIDADSANNFSQDVLIERKVFLLLAYGLPLGFVFLIVLKNIPFKSLVFNKRKKRFKNAYAKFEVELKSMEKNPEKIFAAFKNTLSQIYDLNMNAFTAKEIVSHIQKQHRNADLQGILQKLESQSYGFVNVEITENEFEILKTTLMQLWQKK